MFGIPYFLLEPEIRARLEQQRTANIQRRVAAATPWTTDIKWAKELNIKASTYAPPLLFPELPAVNAKDGNPNEAPDKGILSPDGGWLYMNKILPAGYVLETMQGNREGTVCFDGDVIIPAVHGRQTPQHTWRTRPWMSLTPMEILSLRPGTKRAKGKVIVAGLGLGHQLVEVSKRKQVTELTLIEVSQDLVDWLWPRIEPQLGCKVEVVIGDAQDLLQKMTADVALVDIFTSYGGNHLYKKPRSIRTVWCWGGGG